MDSDDSSLNFQLDHVRAGSKTASATITSAGAAAIGSTKSKLKHNHLINQTPAKTINKKPPMTYPILQKKLPSVQVVRPLKTHTVPSSLQKVRRMWFFSVKVRWRKRQKVRKIILISYKISEWSCMGQYSRSDHSKTTNRFLFGVKPNHVTSSNRFSQTETQKVGYHQSSTSYAT